MMFLGKGTLFDAFLLNRAQNNRQIASMTLHDRVQGKGKKRKEGDSENGSANTQASKRSRR